VKFGTWVQTWHSFPQTKFCKKNRLRGYTPFGQIYTKNSNFGDLGAVFPHFINHNDEIWHESANLRLLPSSQILSKKSLKIRKSPLLRQIYTKNYQFQRFWHFKSDNGEIWRDGTDLEHPPLRALFCKNRLGGFVPWWNIFYQKFEIFAIFSYLSPYFIPIMLKFYLRERTHWGIHQRNKSLKGPAGIALHRGGDAHWFLVLYKIFA